MNNQDIRFLYLRDPKTSRVVTVARRLSEDKNYVEFSFSANRPAPSVDSAGRQHPADPFSKRLGRHIALSRLDKGTDKTVFSVRLEEGVRPIETVVRYLAWENDPNVPRAIKQVARRVWKAEVMGLDWTAFANRDDIGYDETNI